MVFHIRKQRKKQKANMKVLAVYCVVVFTWAHIQTTDGNLNCTMKEKKFKQGSIGWPFNENFCTFARIMIVDKATCTVLDTNTNIVIFNVTATWFKSETYNSQLTFQNRSFLSRVELFNSTTCFEAVFEFTFTKLRQTCAKSLDTKSQFNGTEGSTFTLFLDGDIPTSRNVTWLRNCSTFDTSNLTITADALRFARVKYGDVGTYTNVVTYNGFTQYTSYQFCVGHQVARASLVVSCDSTNVQVKLGGNAAFRCHFNLGPGSINRHGVYTISWNRLKGNSTILNCQSYPFTGPNRTSSVRTGMQCNCVEPKIPLFCHVPTQQERKVTTLSFSSELIIPKVTVADFGSYELFILAAFVQRKTVSLTLSEAAKDRSSLVVGLAASLGALFFLLLLVFILWWNRIYVHVIYKRKFGPYTKDEKEWSAFLSYQFSTNMGNCMQKTTRNVVTATRRALQTLHHTVFDEHKDTTYDGFEAESSIHSMARCHRVVVVLTSAYIKDQWSVFRLQQSFLDMIQSGNQIIFILVPGILEYIRKKGKTDETCLMITRALDLNKAIHWSDKMEKNQKRFKMELEIAMPKIKQNEAFDNIALQEQ